MAGKLKKFLVHGAYRSKHEAKAKEQEVGGFIRRAVISGEKRFLVLTKRK